MNILNWFVTKRIRDAVFKCVCIFLMFFVVSVIYNWVLKINDPSEIFASIGASIIIVGWIALLFGYIYGLTIFRKYSKIKKNT